MTWWLFYFEGWVYLLYRTETFKSKIHSPSSSGAMMLWIPLFPAVYEKGSCCTGWINFSANCISRFMLQLCRAALIYLHHSVAPTLSLLASITVVCAFLFWDKYIASFKQSKCYLTVNCLPFIVPLCHASEQNKGLYTEHTNIWFVEKTSCSYTCESSEQK